MTRQEYEAILGHIRADTYFILSQMNEKNRTYTDVVKEIKDKNLFSQICKEKTIKQYQQKLKNSLKIDKNKVLLEEQKRGIYAITIDDKIVYIGKTCSSFKKRFQDHLRHVNNPEKEEFYVYKLLREAKEKGQLVQLKPLICIEDLKLDSSVCLTKRDLAVMELALIHLYQPIGNISGRLVNCKYLN